MYTIGEFAKQVVVTVHTLQRWDREGRLKGHRAVNNRRYYTDDDLALALGLEKPETRKRYVAYCRVSSPTQKPDFVKQRQTLEQFCSARGLALDEWIEEVGGGLNFNRKRNYRKSLKEALAHGNNHNQSAQNSTEPNA